MYHDKIIFQNGENNSLEIGNDSIVEHSTIIFRGNKNKISIGANSFLSGLNIIVEGDNNEIHIGECTFVMGDTRIYVVDGSKFTMGNGCMFSDHIEIRTTDNHSILDRRTGKRINMEKDIILHDNVWVGTGVTILKGVELAEGCIIGAASCITRKHLKAHTIIAGNPGREIKENVDWIMDRI